MPDDDQAPELIGNDEIIHSTADTLDAIIKDEKIRTKHKFGSFFAESFTNVDLLRFEYDQDSVVVIPPGAPFSLNKKKTRKDDQKDGSSLLSDMANFEQRKVRTRSGRHNSESIRVSSDDEAPTKRIRVSSRSSARVTSPLVRFGSAPSTPSENRETKDTNKSRRPAQRSTSTKELIKPSKSAVDSKTQRRRNNSGRPATQPTKENEKIEIKNEIKKESKKSKTLKGVTGLKNMGNTCYLNTIVQVLASLKCFRMALSEVESAMNQQMSSANVTPTRDDSPKRSNHSRRKRNIASLTKSLQKLVNELQSGNKRTIEPSYFVQAVNEQMPSFKGHLQQDVQEFFCQLLSKLNTEKVPNGLNMPNGDAIDYGSEEILNCVVNRMFTGAWQSEVTCIGCGNSNQNKEQFNTLPLEFPNKYHKQAWTKAITLDQLLDFYTQSERLGRVYDCESCKNTANGRARRTSVRTEAQKRITVLESPKCLFVHLKRAKYSQQNGQEKITCHVDFPLTLKLGPYMTHADKENNPEYLLRAVVVHHGKYFSSGHYTTFCWIDNQNRKNNHSGWVEYNDSEVHPASEKDVLSSQAYMLLYVDRDLANEI